MVNIIPCPQSLSLKNSGTVGIGKLKNLTVSGLAKDTLAVILKDFPGLECRAESKKTFFAEFGKNGKTGSPIPVPEKESGYALSVSADRIRVDAADSAGLWCGLQTATQLAAGDGGNIPFLEIQDWPELKRRGVHWDLKGFQPKFKVLLEEFRRLALFKVNFVLLEIEDKYDFKCAPEVGVPGSYTFKQMRELSRYAAALNISVMPKLQCLGHVDYMLKHARYKDLREDGNPFQFCARSAKGLALWKKMAAELMDCFAEHKYFHVGADETDSLGKCPVCAKFRKADTYIHRVEACLDYVISKGKTPVMWEDILRNLHKNLDPDELEKTWDLGKKAELMYWSYGYGGNNNVFPFLPLYLSRGMRVWGASGFAGCDSWAGSVPPMETRAPNISAWTKSAVENKLEGVVATGWTKIISSTPPTDPQETSWFTCLFAAESMWRGKERGLSDFIDALSFRLYGRRLPDDLHKTVLSISKNPAAFTPETYSPSGVPGLDLLRLAAVAESFAKDCDYLSSHWRMHFTKPKVSLPGYRIKSLRAALDKFTEKLAALEAKTQEALSAFYERQTVDAFIETRFAFAKNMAADYEKMLKSAKEI